MMSPTSLTASAESPNYTCGTLHYTRAGVVFLFGWLLWGDVCYTLMESVVGIVPLEMKRLGCSNWLMGLVLTTIPSLLNMTVCPWVSFKSDRHRGRRGRRIPFILWTMPFLCVSLALTGLSGDIAVWLRGQMPWLMTYDQATIAIALIATFMTLFTFFNMFVSSVFWYLFNDVVPACLLGRFIGLFRIVGTGVSALYNLYVFPHAETHLREILLGASLLYLIGFGISCLKVKEGAYPPVEELVNAASPRGNIRTFFRECFSHRFYLLSFAFTAVSAIASATNMFTVFFQKEMGLNLRQIGELAAAGGISMMVAMFFCSSFVDRWHPLRITVYAAWFNLAALSANWIWLFLTLPPAFYYWHCFGTVVLSSFQLALVNVASLPKDMRLFPKSRFGQFCSAQAMLRSCCTLCAGVLAGLALDGLRRLCYSPDYSYRFLFLWNTVFSVLAALLITASYRMWHRMGGDANYHPPAAWAAGGVELLPITATVGPSSYWLRIFSRATTLLLSATTITLLPIMLMLYTCAQYTACFWIAFLIFPLSIALCIIWRRGRKGLLADIDLASAKATPKQGIPHHGMLIVFIVQSLLAFLGWCVLIIFVILQGDEVAVGILAAASLLNNILLISIVWILRKLEAGARVTIDASLS